MKRFPIQGGLTISWEAAEHAYASYTRKFGSSQSLERLAERGGFGILEFVWLYRGARKEEMCKKDGRQPQREIDENTFARVLAEADIRRCGP